MKTPHAPKVGSESASVPPHESGGNFAAGFFLGVLGGAVGMFLLSADRGRELWHQLQSEFAPWWEEMEDSWQDKVAPLATTEPSAEPLARTQALPANSSTMDSTLSPKKITSSPAHRFPKFPAKPQN